MYCSLYFLSHLNKEEQISSLDYTHPIASQAWSKKRLYLLDERSSERHFGKTLEVARQIKRKVKQIVLFVFTLVRIPGRQCNKQPVYGSNGHIWLMMMSPDADDAIFEGTLSYIPGFNISQTPHLVSLLST